MARGSAGVVQYLSLLIDEASKAKTEMDAQAISDRIARAFRNAGERGGKGLDDELRRALQDVQSSAGRTAAWLEGRFGKMGSFLKDTFTKAFPFTVGDLMARAVMRVTDKVQELIASTISLGINAEETLSKFQTVFGQSADAVEQFLNRWSALAGLSPVVAQDTAATFGAIIEGAGASKDAAAQLAMQILTLAGDLQSFNNVPIQDVLRDIQSGFAGQVEPMRRYGIELTQTRVHAEGLKVAQEMSLPVGSRLANLYATLRIVTHDMGVQLGDMDRTAGSTANRVRSLHGMLQVLQVGMARDLAPTVRGLVVTLDENREVIIKVASALGQVLTASVRAVINLFLVLAYSAEYAWKSTQQMAYQLASSVVDLTARIVQARIAWNEFTKDFSEADRLKQQLELLKANVAMYDSLAAAAGKASDAAAGKVKKYANKDLLSRGTTPISSTPSTNAVPALPQGTDKDNAAAKLDREISLLSRAVTLDNVRVEALKKLRELEKEVAATTATSLDERIKKEERLHQIREAIAKGEVADRQKEIDRIRSTPKSEEKQDALVKARRDVYAELGKEGITDEQRAELLKQKEEIERELKEFSVADTIAHAFDGLIHGATSFGGALSLLVDGVTDFNDLMKIFGKGGAKSLAKELSQIAKMKAAESLANAVSSTARGVWEAAHGNPAAAGSFAAAAKYFLSAGMWGALGAATGAVAGGQGGGGGGGGGASGGNERDGRVGGDEVNGASRPGVVVNLKIDGFNPDKAAHQDLVKQALDQIGERYGDEGGVVVNSGQ